MTEAMEGGLPLSKRYEGSLCEIKSLTNEALACGYIYEISDQYIKLGNHNDIINILRYNTKVKLCVHNVKLGLKVLVGSVYVSTTQFMLISDAASLTDFEKRDFFRIRVSIKGHIMLPAPNHDTPIHCDVEIYDMSLGGILLSSHVRFEVGDRFQIDLDLPAGPLTLQCAVRRISTEGFDPSNDESQSTIYKCGCQLLNCTSKEEDLLWKYILHLQREEILKQKRMLSS
ncbi:MAG TPA: hypothetical protein DIT32_03725 [Peptococcaceae bacterium]|nr:hypothetical protein [Peptococcaceae bacterium]